MQYITRYFSYIDSNNQWIKLFYIIGSACKVASRMVSLGTTAWPDSSDRTAKYRGDGVSNKPSNHGTAEKMI